MPTNSQSAVPPEGAAPESEARALWVSRFDWGRPPLQQSRLRALIHRAADAGFNMVLFQARATGDAYYASRLEPWSYRLTSSRPADLGADPGWDPLAVAIETAHGRGIQLHAYLNVYPIWECGRGAPPHTSPEHPYWTLGLHREDPYYYDRGWRAHAVTAAGPTAMGAAPTDPVPCHEYIWSSPGVASVHEHNLAVVRDVVRRYPVDGVHFDRVRYPGRQFSFDPETQSRLAVASSPIPLADWQRHIITVWVAAARAEVKTHRPAATVSAAVWFTHRKTPAITFPTSQGYHDYYQDSHRWLTEGMVDAIAPMIYGATFDGAVAKWQVLADHHVAVQGSRQVWLGVGGSIPSFAGIADRIAYARRVGARGIAVWSAGSVATNQYWDAFKTGPFREPAVLPVHA